jgi:hypothetical protein
MTLANQVSIAKLEAQIKVVGGSLQYFLEPHPPHLDLQVALP